MDSLNAAQRQAATTTDGPVAIIAGPGTGKTKTLVERVRHLVASGVQPQHILALTFTKKAATEMRMRLGESAAYVATFHALCFDLLRQITGEQPEFITESARMTLIRELTKPATFKGVSARDVALRISRAKNLTGNDAEIAPIATAYNAELAARNLQDFDDILLRTYDLLRADSDWRAVVQKRFTHIMVDEFQDTNLLQYELLQLLRSTDNVCVIGDPLQSIYGFRGASGNIFEQFLADYQQAKQVNLQVNYRSAQKVVTLANTVYPDAPALLAHSKQTGHVQCVEVLNEYSEAAWILARIEQTIGGSDLRTAVSDDVREDQRGLADFAVLYRSRNVARVVQKTLQQSGIPVQIVGEGSPYEAPQVQTIVQMLARMVDPERHIIIKNMSTVQTDALIAALDAAQKPAAIAEQLMQKFGYELDANLRQLCSTLVQFKTVGEATTYFDDIASTGFYDPRADAVTLLTVHAAKGLEFTHVFLLAAEDSVLPSAKGDTPEEKRLFYVAITRAKEQLDILHARGRGGQKAKISPFVAAIPIEVLTQVTDAALANDQRRAAKRHAKRAQASLF